MGNCKFCKIANGNHGDITGIDRKKAFIKGEALNVFQELTHLTLNKANETMNKATL